MAYFCSGKLHIFIGTSLWVNGTETIWSNRAKEQYIVPIEKYYDNKILFIHSMIYIYDMTLSLINGVLLNDTIVNLVSHTFNTIFSCLYNMSSSSAPRWVYLQNTCRA